MEEDSPAKAALRYLGRGWAAIPMRSSDKRPLVPWQTYQERLPTRGELLRWFREHPDAGVGIVTGHVSGLVVLDIDPRHGGEESLVDLEREHDPLPETVEAITGGGGRHIYFRHPGGVVANRVGVAPGIDLRGDGGVVVAPPSLHPSGRRYAWEVSHHPDDLPLAMLPGWLRTHGESGGHSVRYWRSLVSEGVAEGVRNNTIASLAGHLLWHGIDADVALEMLLCWNRIRCRPPLSDEEVEQVVRNISRLHERKRGEGC